MDALHNRINKEFQELQKNKKDASVQVRLVDGNIRHWKGRIKGPIDTCYQGGTFDVDIIIPETICKKPVTAIADMAFSPEKPRTLTHIYFPIYKFCCRFSCK